jgi:soluble lytic murein transglycosylase
VFKFIGSGNSKCEYGRVSYSAIYNQRFMTYLGLRKKEARNQYQDNTLLSALSLIDVDWEKVDNVAELLIDKIMNEVAQRIGKRYRVIDTWGDMTLKDFATYVAQASIEFNVDPWLILSIIETESSFRPSVMSSAKAMGFMQIIPSTGMWIAKRLDINIKSCKEIFKPGINIRMGTWYLSYLLKRFNYDKVVVATAYNAGPARAYKKYVFKETRKYKKRVVKHYNRFVKSIQSKFGAFLNSDVIVVEPYLKEKLSTSTEDGKPNAS